MGRNRTGLVARAIGVLTLVVGLVAVAQQPAAAIIGGQRDTVHTNVGLVRFTTEEGRFRCTGHSGPPPRHCCLPHSRVTILRPTDSWGEEPS